MVTNRNLCKHFIANLGIILLLCTITFVAFTMPVTSTTNEKSYSRTEHITKVRAFSKTQLSGLTPHASIIITSNAQLAAEATSGAGTIAHPYIISGYNITNNNPYSLDIETTNLPVIIENCYFNNEGNSSNYGINYFAVDNLTIQNNYFENSGIGIYGDYSTGIIIKNNTISQPSDTALEFYFDTKDFIDSNTIIGGGQGIYNSVGKNTTIINNSFNQTSDPINFYDSNYDNVSNNLILNSYSYAIQLSYCIGDYISRNTLVNVLIEGIIIYGGKLNIIDGNNVTGFQTTTNGIHLINSYYDSVTGNKIKNATCLLRVETSYWNNITENQFIDSSGNATVIYESYFNTISLSTFKGQSDFSLVIYNGSSNRIIENNFTYSKYYDLALDLENNSVVQANNFLNLGHYLGSQAVDNGFNNLFVYNYWAGWTGPDVNSDGIVDNPYLIDGPAHSYDMKPLTAVNGMTNIGISKAATSSATPITVTVTINGSATTTSNNKSSPGFTTIALVSGLIILTVFAILKRRKLKDFK